jgi:hypothetical protein
MSSSILASARFIEKSMRARYRVGIGWSFRPASRDGIFKHFLRSPGIDSKESIPPSYVPSSLAGWYDNPTPSRFLAPIDCSKIPAQSLHRLEESIPGLFKSFKKPSCAAKAFYSCPAIISQRPESQKISKEPQENTEEESKIIQARSHINSEKLSRNYKPSEE